MGRVVHQHGITPVIILSVIIFIIDDLGMDTIKMESNTPIAANSHRPVIRPFAGELM
jgi:hypothetical protein